jgi:enamine deaminase RidA (YjgF/YER057c/UK114 family)
MAVEAFDPPGVPMVDGISQVAVATGTRMAFFSGQVGRNEDGTPAGDDLRSQTRQALKNLETLTNAVGADASHIAKWTLYIKDYTPEQFESYMAGFGDYLEGGGTFAPVTAGTLVGVSALFEPWCLVEIDAIAVLD